MIRACYSCPSLRFLKINQPMTSAASARKTKNQFMTDWKVSTDLLLSPGLFELTPLDGHLTVSSLPDCAKQHPVDSKSSQRTQWC